MKTFFKSFIKGGVYYGVALYLLLLFVFDVSVDWWIVNTIILAIAFCFVDYFATIEIRDALSGESYWRNQYFLEKESHKGTQKRYIVLIQKLKEAEKLISEAYAEKLKEKL